jgi:cytochrome c oxidase subunit 2
MMHLIRLLLCLPEGASTFATRIDLLHFAVIATTMLGSFYIFLMAAWFAVRWYRGDRAPRASTPKVLASGKREATIIGGVLVLFVAFWVVGFTQYVDMASPPKDAMTIVVTGKQWMWKFTYPNGRDTNDVLTVPVHKPIRLLMTSRDVIHSFFVPQFRIKHDLIPGQYVTTWFEATKVGEYDIFCAEYCGVNHSRMLGRVVVLSASDYEAWLRKEDAAPGGDDLVQRGLSVATRRACVACHTLDGQTHVGPTWARLYGRVVTLEDGRRTTADDAYLTRSMMEPNADVVAGFKPVMPSYQGVLSPAEVGALVELIRSLKNAPIAPSVALPRLDVTSLDAGVGAPGPGNVGALLPPPSPPPGALPGALGVPGPGAPLPIEPGPPAPDRPLAPVPLPPGSLTAFPTRPPAPAPEPGEAP